MSKLRDTLDAVRRSGLHVDHAELVGKATLCLMHNTDPAMADKLAEGLLDVMEESESDHERVVELLAKHRSPEVEELEVEEPEVEEPEVEEPEVEEPEVEEPEVEEPEVEEPEVEEPEDTVELDDGEAEIDDE